MGYRSCAAILMYGEKRECELVMDLFMQSGEVDDYTKVFFEDHKQESNAGTQHFVFWSFDNVKWYDQADDAKNKLFNLVNQVEHDHDRGDPADRTSLAIEFVRFGEDDNDNEHESTERSAFMLEIRRHISHPEFFQWCPSP
jgi:hypothetical protein